MRQLYYFISSIMLISCLASAETVLPKIDKENVPNLYNKVGFEAAEFSYKVMNGKCPKNSDEEKCSEEEEDKLNETLRNAYLAGLAEIRAKSLACSIRNLENLHKDEKKYNQFVNEYSNRLVDIGKQNSKMDLYRPAVAIDKKADEAHKDARLHSELLMSSLSYTEIEPMKFMVNHITSQSDFFSGKKIHPDHAKYINTSVKDGLQRSLKKMREDKTALDKGIVSLGFNLSTGVKQSLAQDQDLVDTFVNSVKNPAEILPVHCLVSARFGKGVEYRDNAVLVATLLNGAGILKGALKLDMLAAKMARLARMGGFPKRAASILSVANKLSMQTVFIDYAITECFPAVKMNVQINEAALSCEEDNLTSVENHCILNTLFALKNLREIVPKKINNTAEIRELMKIHRDKVKATLRTP